MSFLIYFVIILIIPILASMKVMGTYSKYSKKTFNTGLTGYEVARKILDENGLNDIRVEITNGRLSDHYDPNKRIVRLSEDNYKNNTISAAAVAAHEVGHALQHSEEYFFLRFRSMLVPVANLGSNLSFIVILAGIVLNMMNLIVLGTIFMAFAVLFQLVTLPVEFDASKRALDQMHSSGILALDEERGAKKVLNAAAMTYVAGALVAIAELIRFILIIVSSD